MVYETQQIETSHSFQSRKTSQAGLQLKKCWIDSPKGTACLMRSSSFGNFILRLAVNKELQGNGIGKWLLSQVFIKAVQVSDITGLYLIIVDAKETSKSFYEYYGFQRLVDEDLSYFVMVDTIRKAIQG